MFNHMKIYTVHVKPDDTGPGFKPVFIKEGFNFAAFILTFFWALYRRLWLVAFVLFIVNALLLAALKAHIFARASISAFHLGIHFVVGFHANDWVRARLSKQGYILTDITAGDNYLHAQQRYLERYVAAAAPA